MEKCATGVCLPIGSLMDNKPLLIGIAVAVLALVIGGYFWFFRKDASAETPSQGEEPQVEEFVGRQQADFEAAQAEAQQQQQQQQQQQKQQQQPEDQREE
jgi:hypothetical protein